MRQRPQFFIDLERELAGLEPEEAKPAAPIPVTVPKGSTLAEVVQQMGLSGVDQTTATGAMIAASQQRAQIEDLMRQRLSPFRFIPDAQEAQANNPYRMGPIWDSLGAFGGLFGGR